MERRSEREKRGRGGHCEWKGNTREEARGGRGEEQREIYISRGACIRSGLFIFRNIPRDSSGLVGKTQRYSIEKIHVRMARAM